MLWKTATKRAASACDALGLAAESFALTYVRSPDTARRAALKAEERAIALATSARFLKRQAPAWSDDGALDLMIERADALIERCADVNEAIETYELEPA